MLPLEEFAPGGPLLVSACLVGAKCRYDGQLVDGQRLDDLSLQREVVPFCPEVAGGLSVPRTPARFEGGDGAAVLRGAAGLVPDLEVARERGLELGESGTELTRSFVAGARLAGEMVRRWGVTGAVLKQGSPSCGTRRVKTETGRVSGLGVAAAGLAEEGLPMRDES